MKTDLMYAGIGSIAAGLNGVIAQVNLDPKSLEAVAKWPSELISAAVCIVAVFMLYKSNRDTATRITESQAATLKTLSELATAIREHTAAIESRPCASVELAKMVQTLAAIIERHEK